ncbi:Rieske (2Fe-2S) protein [Frankia nepalensis]|uniref:Rieske (2Fe-2S) protein n=1 Tax=Frankia nepalensis TaxID=1836974 RepID=UPI001EE490A1|nr:Rieske (2Fe-2S) protein [Frankia nepalensis]
MTQEPAQAPAGPSAFTRRAVPALAFVGGVTILAGCGDDGAAPTAAATSPSSAAPTTTAPSTPSPTATSPTAAPTTEAPQGGGATQPPQQPPRQQPQQPPQQQPPPQQPPATQAPPPPPPAGTRLASVSEVPSGGGVIRQGVVLTNAGGTVRGFSATCTHQGCTVGDVSGGTINCPCHGSRFDAASGAVVAGPAQRALPGVRVVVQDGVVYRP